MLNLFGMINFQAKFLDTQYKTRIIKLNFYVHFHRVIYLTPTMGCRLSDIQQSGSNYA